MVDLLDNSDIISPSRSNAESLRRSYMTSTPIKIEPAPSSDDDIIILNVIAGSGNPRQIKKEALTFDGTPRQENFWKLRKEIKYSYKRMTYRVDKMIDEGFKKDLPASPKENRLRSRSTSRSKRSRDWIQDHPYIDKAAPVIIFLVFAAMIFLFVSQLVAQKIPQKFTAMAFNYGHQAYHRLHSFLK